MADQSFGPDEFYVGYLPVPWGHSRFLRVAIPVTLWLMVFVAMGFAWTQRDPGGAVWDDGFEQSWTGVIRARPYPMLEIEEGDGAGSVALLVEQGKRGALGRCGEFNNLRVTVRGWRLQRDGRRIIELSPEADAIERVSDQTVEPRPADADSIDNVSIRGEIVDAKCFLGAMKPGEGSTHKSCAILCITGGIPPMLVARDAAGKASYFLVTDATGGPMTPALIPLVGEPVTVEGLRVRRGDLDEIRVNAKDVKKR
jgi:hypothetical protein